MPSPAETLRAAARRYEREKSKVDKQLARITSKRDAAIRTAHADGMTQREIAKLAGLSFQRVSQIIRGARL